MKTPRELLLQRHAAVTPQLDALRREVVRELDHEGTKAQRPFSLFVSLCLRGSTTLWHELVWPCRRTWAGLATVWVVLLVFNAAHTDRSQVVVAKTTAPSSTVRLAFIEQREFLIELLGPATPASPAEPPRRPCVQPRSEYQNQIRVA
ncbi:MAG: hypothetical protein RL380_250 [Verrucomicrobiota bacterium]